MAKTAFITGISGQDGAYLAKLLLEKGYRVVGATRRTASINTLRLQYLGVENDGELIDFDLLEFTNILRVIEQTAPDEIYNLAAQSFVGTSFEQPLLTGNVNALGVTRILEAIRTFGISSCRFYQASTSELFGPIACLYRVEDFDEALDVANSTAYKLTGAVYSRKPSNLEKARREFRVGNLYLNRGSTGALVGRQPFGGFGMSGVGSKAGGRDYLLQFVEPRAICENTMRRGFAPGL